MKLAVFGATGGTGRHVIRQALCAGHEIRALVRSPGEISSCSDITVIEGDVLDPQSVATAVDGTDAVLCLLGKTPNNPADIVSRGTEHIITAMETREINRLVVLTSMGLGASVRTLPWYVRIATATVLHELMADKARQEELVMGSTLEWTIVRPGGLTDRPPTGEYVHGTDSEMTAAPISRADVAAFLLQILEEDMYVRETPAVTTREPADIGFLWEQITGVARRIGRG